LQRGDLIHEGVVAERAFGIFLGQRGMGEEAEAAKTVVEADEGDAVFGEDGAVVYGGRAAAVDEAAAVDPDHDGEVFGGGVLGEPDVDDEAVFVGCGAEGGGVRGEWELLAIVAVVGGGADAGPVRDGLWCAPAEIANRGRGVRDALVGGDAIGGDARELAGVYFDLLGGEGRGKEQSDEDELAQDVSPGKRCEMTINECGCGWLLCARAVAGRKIRLRSKFDLKRYEELWACRGMLCWLLW